MLDIHFIRAQRDLVQHAVRSKKATVDVDRLLELDGRRRVLQQKIDAVSEERHAVARTSVPSPEMAAQTEKGRALKEDLGRLEEEFSVVRAEYEKLMEQVPNVPTPDTPEGPDASGNRVLRQWGSKPSFTGTPKEHWEIGSSLGVLDTARAAAVSGSRFVYLKGDLVLLQFALVQHALGVLSNRHMLERIRAQADLPVAATPFLPVIPPVLITPEVLRQMARLEPKDDRYYLPADDLYLVGSAEHTLGPLHRNETLPEDTFPRRYVGYSTAFRREAGSYGKDVRGLLRLHQFDKLEIESFTLPEHGVQEQEFFVAIQEYLLQSLGIPYQVVLICTGDMGLPDARQIDMEVWFPGQGRYRETHTADYMSDYQARRLQTKVRRRSGRSEFVHMNDATVFAIGRTLAAVLEVYQKDDGTVEVPLVLRPALGGRSVLAPATG